MGATALVPTSRNIPNYFSGMSFRDATDADVRVGISSLVSSRWCLQNFYVGVRWEDM